MNRVVQAALLFFIIKKTQILYDHEWGESIDAKEKNRYSKVEICFANFLCILSLYS